MGMMRTAAVLSTALGLLLAAPGPCPAQQGKVIQQQLDSNGEGYTVLKVWGTDYQMGYAQGHLLAKPIVQGVQEVKKTLGLLYGLARTHMQSAVWVPAGIDQELDGMVAGIKARLPGAQVDKLDLKVSNTYGDWAYTMACRSHSAWGTFVKAPTRTLSTRRLDFSVPAALQSVKHHVLVARHPSGGAPRWVNLAWPGYVTTITGVNEYGTLNSVVTVP